MPGSRRAVPGAAELAERPVIARLSRAQVARGRDRERERGDGPATDRDLDGLPASTRRRHWLALRRSSPTPMDAMLMQGSARLAVYGGCSAGMIVAPTSSIILSTCACSISGQKRRTVACVTPSAR